MGLLCANRIFSNQIQGVTIHVKYMCEYAKISKAIATSVVKSVTFPLTVLRSTKKAFQQSVRLHLRAYGLGKRWIERGSDSCLMTCFRNGIIGFRDIVILVQLVVGSCFRLCSTSNSAPLIRHFRWRCSGSTQTAKDLSVPYCTYSRVYITVPPLALATHVYMRVKAEKLNEKDETRIRAAEMNCMRRTARYILIDYNGNEGIRKLTKTVCIQNKILKRRTS